jgi:hypothetical protein
MFRFITFRKFDSWIMIGCCDWIGVKINVRDDRVVIVKYEGFVEGEIVNGYYDGNISFIWYGKFDEESYVVYWLIYDIDNVPLFYGNPVN